MKKMILNLLEKYLTLLAKNVLASYRPTIIGITGSVGKTTTRQTVFHVLHKAGLAVKQTEGNLNAELGIALTILGFDHSPSVWEWPLVLILATLNWFLATVRINVFPQYFVVEMGIDRIGDMERLLNFITPKIGVITWIGEGHHLEYLKNPETIAKEKGKILSVLPNDGLAIIPAQDPQSKLLESLASAPVLKISSTGLEAANEIAETIANHIGVNPEQVKQSLRSVERPKGRLTELPGINDSILIDDSYNSSYPSAKLALEFLAKYKGKRKIAILGDILEQGDDEAKIHQNVAALSKKLCEVTITVGKRMHKVDSDKWYANPDEAASEVGSIVQPGDVVLVKGSQGMRMEKVSYALAADKKEASKRLPRQGVRWRQIPFGNP